VEVQQEVCSLDMLDQQLMTLVLQPPTTAAARMVDLVQLAVEAEAVEPAGLEVLRVQNMRMISLL
jgi:hypothetical protein